MSPKKSQNVVPITSTTGGRKLSAANQGTTGSPTTSLGTPTSGSPPSGPTDWSQSVESRLADLGSDVRNLLIGGCVIAAALVGAGWVVYVSASEKMSDLAVSQQTIVGKIETLDAKISGKFDLMEQRYNDHTKAGTGDVEIGRVREGSQTRQ